MSAGAGSGSARGAVALTGASVAAGVMNYLYQVHGAVALDEGAFGALSAWLAQITLASSVATVVQFVSLDFRTDRFDALVRPLGLVSLAAIAAQLVFARDLAPLSLGVVTVAGAIAMYAVIGQLQGRLLLGLVAGAIFAASLGRLALSFVTTFFVAHAASAFIGLVAIAALLGRGARGGGAALRPPRTGVAARLSRSVLLAFATVLFPMLDVLVLSFLHDEVTLGVFARLALASRIVFFAVGAVLPVLLPHQIRANEHDEEPPAFVDFAHRWIGPLAIVSSLALAFVADAFVLHARADHATWLYLSCASAALLVSTLVQVQRLAARAEIARAGACVGAALAVSVGAALVGQASVTRYVLFACAGNALVLLASTMLASRPCRS